jgi:hypothetical protein
MKYIKYSIIALALLIFATSCEDYLDKSPGVDLSEEEVFSDYQSAKGFLDKVYVLNQDYFLTSWNGYIFALGDEGVTTTIGGPSLHVNSGNWQDGGSVEMSFDCPSATSINLNSYAGMAFKNIRAVNLLMSNINDIKNITEAQKNELLGQAYFFRAWNYFQLIRRYGGWFIFDKVFAPDDNLDLPRLSYQESTDWLVSDLDKAFELLPDSWPGSDKGRVTKTAAKGLKGWALLYAASPTMNSDLKYNIEYCKLAAKASAEAIDYVNSKNIYKLMPGQTVEDYNKIFYSKTQLGSEEAIFYKIGGTNYTNGRPSAACWNANFIVRSRESANVHLATPTQNFVDLFETKDGLPIGDPASGYNDQAPYSNREPRFYYNILYHGQEWGFRNGVRQPIEFWAENTYDTKISADYQSQPQYYPRVPYMIRKWWPESANVWQNDYQYYMVSIYMRVAQLYLDFAEAANEAYGPNGAVPGTSLTAVEAINIVRARVGAVPILSKHTTSKEVFRERIWNERTVELCFENHRWFDIRRWHIAKDVIKNLMKPVITRVGDNKYTYRYERLPDPLQKVFEEKHYWYPILQSEMDKVSVFKQNPGW